MLQGVWKSQIKQSSGHLWIVNILNHPLFPQISFQITSSLQMEMRYQLYKNFSLVIIFIFGCYSSYLSGKTPSYFVIHGLNLTPHILYKCRSTKEEKLNNMHRSMKVMSTVTRVLTSWTDRDIRKWTTSSPFYPQPAIQLNSVIISLVQKLKASFLKNVSLVGRSEPSHQLLLTDLKILGYISTDSLGSKCVPSCPMTQTNS